MWTKRARMEHLTFKGTWDKHLLSWFEDLPTLWALNEKTLEANEPRSLKLMIGSSPKCPTPYLLCIRTLRISSRKASLWNTYRILVQILIQSHLQVNFWSFFPIFFSTLSNLFKPKRHFGQSKSRNSRMASVVRLYSDRSKTTTNQSVYYLVHCADCSQIDSGFSLCTSREISTQDLQLTTNK